MTDDADLTRAVRTARSSSQLATVGRDIARTLGFQHFLFGARLPLSLTKPLQFIFSGYPVGWRSRYDALGYMEADPVLERGLNSSLPFAWDELRHLSPNARRVLEDAAAYGLRHGFTAAVHAANGEVAMLSMARDTPLPSAPAQRLQLLQRGQWYCSVMHERLRVLAACGSESLRPQLSERQRDCLRLAAEGKPAHAIARDLRISERTVVYHLNCAGSKLGVRTRAHAIARALAVGEIRASRTYPALGKSQQFVQLPPN